MIKFSKNKKLNAALSAIYNDLMEFDTDESGKSSGEIKRYYQEFKSDKTAPDYNIAQYGNLLVYYNQVYDFYKNCGYLSTAKYSAEKIWQLYLRQVGYIVRNYYINA